MAVLKYRLVPEGDLAGYYNPLSLVLLDKKDIDDCGLSVKDAVYAVAKQIPGAAGIDVYDRDTITTTSDGLLVECAMIAIAASDKGRINEQYGYLPMLESEYSEELVKEEPCLEAWDKLYKGKRLFRGPDPKYKKIPLHNAAITGSACNNNSASEIINLVSMREMLFPFLGLRSLFFGEDVKVGYAGGAMSVSIGMMVPETNGRISPIPVCTAGDTLHNSGEYAQTLKATLPSVTCTKAMLVEYIARHLEVGMVPGVQISVAPSILIVAKLLGKEIAWDNITKRAWVELESIGYPKSRFDAMTERMTVEEIKARADELIPGMENAVLVHAPDVVKDCSFEV